MPASTVDVTTFSISLLTAENRPPSLRPKLSRIARQFDTLLLLKEGIDLKDLAGIEVKDWPRIKIQRGSFIPEKWAGKTPKRTSWIRDYGYWVA